MAAEVVICKLVEELEHAKAIELLRSRFTVQNCNVCSKLEVSFLN